MVPCPQSGGPSPLHSSSLERHSTDTPPTVCYINALAVSQSHSLPKDISHYTYHPPFFFVQMLESSLQKAYYPMSHCSHLVMLCNNHNVHLSSHHEQKKRTVYTEQQLRSGVTTDNHQNCLNTHLISPKPRLHIPSWADSCVPPHPGGVRSGSWGADAAGHRSRPGFETQLGLERQLCSQRCTLLLQRTQAWFQQPGWVVTAIH